MPLYSYVAVNKEGKRISNSTEAEGEAQLKAHLQERGMTPIKISPVERRTEAMGQRRKRLGTKDLLVFTEELSGLLEAGFPIDRALYVLSAHTGNPQMRALLGEIYMDIQRGQSLSQSMGKHKVFPRIYVNMIRAGEVSGELENSTRRLAEFLSTTVAFQEEVASALVYPAFLALAGSGAVGVILFYVIPKFAVIFEDMGRELPGPTQAMLSLSQYMVDYWWLGIGVLGILAVMLQNYLSSPQGQRVLDEVKLKAPLYRTLHMKLVIARYARTMGTLLQSGVPILEALGLARGVAGNSIISQRLELLEDGVKKGKGIASPLRDSAVFPPIVTQMVAVGEEAGKLEHTFLSVAEKFEAESKTAIKRLVSIIGPSIILLMAVIIGALVLSLLMAVFSINDIPL